MDIQTLVKLNAGRTEHTGDRPMDIQDVQNIQMTDPWIYRHGLNLMHPIAINLSIVTIQHVFKSLGG